MLPISAGGVATPLLDRLRSDTHDAHKALENALLLLQQPLRRERFVRVLGGFLAFHRVWEPKMSALIKPQALVTPRLRIALIERDLQALGARDWDSQGPSFDLGFLQSPSAAWGSLYVMEGSTLGGRVISKALRDAPWAPLNGLAYFNPYGARTAQMWAGFRNALQATAPSLEADCVSTAARATFQVLQTRLVSPKDAAA